MVQINIQYAGASTCTDGHKRWWGGLNWEGALCRIVTFLGAASSPPARSSITGERREEELPRGSDARSDYWLSTEQPPGQSHWNLIVRSTYTAPPILIKQSQPEVKALSCHSHWLVTSHNFGHQREPYDIWVWFLVMGWWVRRVSIDFHADQMPP